MDATRGTERRHTILLIDDEPMNLEMLETFFEETYDVLTADDGTTALDLLAGLPDPGVVHCIISDQRMPGMSGVRFFERSLEIVPGARRILLTAYTDIDAIIESINRAQIHTFAQKPVDLFNFGMIVARALETWELAAENRGLARELERANAELEQQVKQRTAELRAAVKELEQARDIRSRMLAVLGHDLANPFTYVLGSARMLSERGDSFNEEQRRSLLRGLWLGVNRISDLLQDLLRWSAVQLGRAEAVAEQVACGPLIHGVLELVRAAAEGRGVMLEVATIGPDIRVRGDAGMIKSILRNLLANAIKFTPRGGVVRIDARRDGDTVALSVKDTGPGIAPEQIASLFHADPASRRPLAGEGDNSGRGTGLGLLLCHDFAGMCGGSIDVSSVLGEGATFTVTLPADG